MTRKWLHSVDVETETDGRASFDKALSEMDKTISPADCTPLTETASGNDWTEVAALPAGTRYVHIAVRQASVFVMPADAAPPSGDGLLCLVNSERRLATAGKAKLYAKSVVTDTPGKVSGIAYQS